MKVRGQQTESKTEDPGTRKSLGTNQSMYGGFGAAVASKERIKPTDFTDLFVSPNEPPKKRDNITLEMSLLKIYTKMRNEFLSNHEYYNFIKDVDQFYQVTAQQVCTDESHCRSLWGQRRP